MMKKKTTKATALLLAAMLSVSLFAGCSSTGTPSQSPVGSTSSADGTESKDNTESMGGSITLMSSQNWIKDVDRELFKKFQEKTGTEVKVLVTPDNGYDTLLGTSLSGESNAVDMFMYSAGTPMVSAGIPDVALDLSEEAWADRLEEWAKNANTYDGKLYGFSTWGIDYEGILYNKTYFEENKLSVPKTWDAFVKLCDQIVELGKTPLYESINGTWHTQTWLYGFTQVMYDEKEDLINWLNASKDNKFASLSCVKEGLTQLSAFLSTTQDGKPKYFTNDGQAEDWFGSYTALTNRDCVMMATYSAYPAELAEKGCKDTWGMFPIPLCDNKAVVANGGGYSKYINKNSQNIDKCKALLDFLAEQENLETYYSARTDLVTASFQNVASVKSTDATKDAIANSEGTPPVMIMKDMLYWDQDMYKYFQGFVDGSTTPDQFLENMDNYRATMFDAAAAQ